MPELVEIDDDFGHTVLPAYESRQPLETEQVEHLPTNANRYHVEHDELRSQGPKQTYQIKPSQLHLLLNAFLTQIFNALININLFIKTAFYH